MKALILNLILTAWVILFAELSNETYNLMGFAHAVEHRLFELMIEGTVHVLHVAAHN